GAAAGGRSRAAVVRRVATTGATAGAATASVLLAAAVAGFWWPDGLDATREAYWSGAASVRPALYLTLAGNPGALALAVGPAVAFGLAGLGDAGLGDARLGNALRARLLPAAALAAVVAADLSQHARGEVERIWLPFVPWLALAAPGHRRGWLAVQVTVAIALQAAVRSPW
ncbi:MAG TPA: hypothetical protein VJM49_02750, partial [Acidimicrobiales bacterium]|nr:hypothetical protein [Acidimicrobiales bacterium]